MNYRKGECLPLIRTDGVHHVSKENVDRKKSGHTCGGNNEGQWEGERPWTFKKRSRHSITRLGKITGVCEISFDSMS
jgi:hypothetical protein